MGKSLPFTTTLHDFSIQVSSPKLKTLNPPILSSTGQISASEAANPSRVRVNSERVKLSMESSAEEQNRMPLAMVVSDCVKRWFQDTLKEAKSGDITMQVLVGQMYYSGYGVPRDAQKGRAWISKASKRRSSAWDVCDKHPGYNASESDSDEMKDDAR